jgi:uncharacterized RDD family membrane protein YckC
LGYYILFETFCGATIGKLILGLRVRHGDGSPIGLGAAFWRNLLRIVDYFPYFIPYLLGAIVVWPGRVGSALANKAADTIVTWR